MKKLIFLLVSIIFLTVAAHAQTQSLNTNKSQTQEQKVSPQSEKTTVTSNSKMSCNPPSCKKGSSCCQNKTSKTKDGSSSQTLGNSNNPSSANSPVVDNALQPGNMQVVKEQPSPKK